MDNTNNQITPLDLSIFENVDNGRFIEGVYIYDRWMDDPLYPEPPCEIEEPTIDSDKIYESYRKALSDFALKMTDKDNQQGLNKMDEINKLKESLANRLIAPQGDKH